jgi:hypothetical protein
MKSDDKKIKYDEMSGSYFDDFFENLESIYDAGSILDNWTLQSGSQKGRDDKSAETSITDITTDCTDTSDITMEDLREEAVEMCGRTCHTLDASLGGFTKTRAYRILSMIGKKSSTETIKVFQSVPKLKLSEVTGFMDKSFKCLVGVMDTECETCESKTKSCTEGVPTPAHSESSKLIPREIYGGRIYVLANALFELFLVLFKHYFEMFS